MTRALVIVEAPLTGLLAGPAIRALALARRLRPIAEVTFAARQTDARSYEGFRVVPYTRNQVIFQALRHDVVIAPWIPPYLYLLPRRIRPTLISDMYDPVDVELTSSASNPRARALLREVRDLVRLQAAQADVVLCASAEQRERLAAQREGLAPLVVPLSIDEPPSGDSGRPIRARFPQIGEDDVVLLWWGSLWRWLDPVTAVRAVALVRAQRPDVRLVFTSGAPPDDRLVRHQDVGSARQAAADLGLLDEGVFFYDEWIPYRARHEILNEADLGVTLHADDEESALAARARVLDYVWAGVPCALSGSNALEQELGRAGAARLVPKGDPGACARALLELLDPGERERAVRACAQVGSRHRLGAVDGSFARAVTEPPAVRPKGPARAAARYYARRVLDVRDRRMSGG